MSDQSSQYHLSVGTEVSAKYRGAFCEAKIKSLKKSVIFTVKPINKSTPKSHPLSEDCVKGNLKIGANVEARLTDQTTWCPAVITAIKDKSIYTVEFDDGDIRSLPRNFLCLQGVRHYPESDTLDHLPLTDPENFGNPVVKRNKIKRNKTSLDPADGEDSKSIPPSPKRKKTNPKEKITSPSEEVEEENEASNRLEMRKKWLEDRLMGRLVLAGDGRKINKFPAVVVNPMIRDDFMSIGDNSIVVRSFITGKFSVVPRVPPLTSTSPKMETCKELLKDACQWLHTNKIPDTWKTDVTSLIPDLISDDEDQVEEKDANEARAEKRRKIQSFLEQVYKFMEDNETPITKTPVLGYKDLDLYKLYNLVQARGGWYGIGGIVGWREVYAGLKIPKHNAAGNHHAKQAYIKYLLRFEEYSNSFRNLPRRDDKKTREEDAGGAGRRASRRGRVTEPPQDEEATKSSVKRRRSNQTKKVTRYKLNDILLIRYKVETSETYRAKVVRAEEGVNGEMKYYVHYPGWNIRFDEWVESDRIVGYTKDDKQNNPVRRPKNASLPLEQDRIVVKEEPKNEVSLIKKESVQLKKGEATQVKKEVPQVKKDPLQMKKLETTQVKKGGRQRRGSSSSMIECSSGVAKEVETVVERAASEEIGPIVKSRVSKKKISNDADDRGGKLESGRRTSGRSSNPPPYLQDSTRFPLKPGRRKKNAIPRSIDAKAKVSEKAEEEAVDDDVKGDVEVDEAIPEVGWVKLEPLDDIAFPQAVTAPPSEQVVEEKMSDEERLPADPESSTSPEVEPESSTSPEVDPESSTSPEVEPEVKIEEEEIPIATECSDSSPESTSLSPKDDDVTKPQVCDDVEEDEQQAEEKDVGASESGEDKGKEVVAPRRRRRAKRKDPKKVVPELPYHYDNETLDRMDTDSRIAALEEEARLLRKVWQQCRLEVQRLDRKKKRRKRLNDGDDMSSGHNSPSIQPLNPEQSLSDIPPRSMSPEDSSREQMNEDEMVDALWDKSDCDEVVLSKLKLPRKKRAYLYLGVKEIKMLKPHHRLSYELMRFYINSTIISNENCRKLLFMDTDFIQAIKMCSLQRQMIERVKINVYDGMISLDKVDNHWQLIFINAIQRSIYIINLTDKSFSSQLAHEFAANLKMCLKPRKATMVKPRWSTIQWQAKSLPHNYEDCHDDDSEVFLLQMAEQFLESFPSTPEEVRCCSDDVINVRRLMAKRLLVSGAAKESFCSKCGDFDIPEEASGSMAEWVQCDRCRRWYHMYCASTIVAIEENRDWICRAC